MSDECFEDPETFDPDRFSPENRSQLTSGSYMPFGFGPRQCMGMKMARMEMKVLIYHLVRHFSLEKCEKTCFPLKFSKDMTPLIEGGTWLTVNERSL